MLDPHEHELLGIHSYNVLNDIASHWKTKSELSAQRMGEQKVSECSHPMYRRAWAF